MSFYIINYPVNVWRGKGPKDCLIVLEKWLQHGSINMQRDDESTSLAFLLPFKTIAFTFKSNLMNHRQRGDLTDGDCDELTNTPIINGADVQIYAAL